MTRLLIAGATGLVGGHALSQALTDPRVSYVVAPTRRPLAANGKLHNPIIDFARLLGSADRWDVDAVICALGTTRAAAGSAAAFRAVDFDIPFALAQHARDGGATRMALTSSMGADARSLFLYTRTKGELEDALERLGWKSLTIVRPSLLGGHRKERRLGEQAAKVALSSLAPIIPRRFRISPATEVARVLMEGVLAGLPGLRLIKSGDLIYPPQAPISL